jgi:hypothetical protein
MRLAGLEPPPAADKSADGAPPPGADGHFEEQYGFIDVPKWLVEDWLNLPWPLASQATLPAATSRLEPGHARLTAHERPTESAYSASYSPGRNCARPRTRCSSTGDARCARKTAIASCSSRARLWRTLPWATVWPRRTRW